MPDDVSVCGKICPKHDHACGISGSPDLADMGSLMVGKASWDGQSDHCPGPHHCMFRLDCPNGCIISHHWNDDGTDRYNMVHHCPDHRPDKPRGHRSISEDLAEQYIQDTGTDTHRRRND